MNLDNYEFDDYDEDYQATVEPTFDVDPYWNKELDLEYMFF